MQKELLDTELDLYKKMQAGEEVTELRRKYTELQLEVCLLQPHSWLGRSGYCYGEHENVGLESS